MVRRKITGKVTEYMTSGAGTAARGKYEILNLSNNRKNDSWKIRRGSQFEESGVEDTAVKFLDRKLE